MERDGGGKASQTASQCHSRCKKEHIMNMDLTDADEEAIVDFVKNDKTHNTFKDKAREDCLWERFAGSRNLSVKVCKIWFESQRTCYGKVTKFKSGQVPKK